MPRSPTRSSLFCRVDNKGNPLSTEDIDAKGASKHKRPITYHLKKASKTHETQKEKETPLELLEAAYKKLTHDDMEIKAIAYGDFKKARELAAAIKDRADELESEIYRIEKEFKKMYPAKKQ